MKSFVTGGGGFLGGAIVKALKERGDEVICLQRGNYPELNQSGVKAIQGDMTDQTTVDHATKGCDVVYHVAGLTGVWGLYEDYYHINVTGTECVLNACRKNHIKKLVYTSSPSVIFNGIDEENVDESIPYPETYYNHYQRTKSTAEQMILAANENDLATVALRPHLIWGPGDPHLVGRILERAKKQKLKLVAGKQNLVDTTYIDNAALAHLMAADKLDIGSPCSGKAYFITNGEPRVMSDIINGILKSHDMPEITSTVPAQLLYIIGTISEWVYSFLRIKSEPMMTRFIARQLTCAHWYNLDAAIKDLEYQPKISIEEGMQKLHKAFKDSQ